MDTLYGYARQPAVSSANVKLSRTAIVFVMGVLGISYLLNAMGQLTSPALAGGIRAIYGFTLALAGFVGTVFTIHVAPFGVLSGRFRSPFIRKSILAGGLAGYSLFMLLTPLAQGVVGFALYRSLTGVGEALQTGTIHACMGSYFERDLGAAMGREHMDCSPVAASSVLGMYGLGAMCAVVGSWAGDRRGRPGIFFGLAILAAGSFCLFDRATHAASQNALSFDFGLMVSGFFHSRFAAFSHRGAHPDYSGYAVSAAMTGFYLSGPFAGYFMQARRVGRVAGGGERHGRCAAVRRDRSRGLLWFRTGS